jgi:hypothetical protein
MKELAELAYYLFSQTFFRGQQKGTNNSWHAYSKSHSAWEEKKLKILSSIKNKRQKLRIVKWNIKSDIDY